MRPMQGKPPDEMLEMWLAMPITNCTAALQTCHKCQGRNHLARVCCSSVKPVHVVEESSDSETEMYIGTVTKTKNSKNEWNVIIKVDKRDITLKLDNFYPVEFQIAEKRDVVPVLN